MGKKVLVCGDRNWYDYVPIRRELSMLPPDTVVIEGEARGADSIARDVARELGLQVLPFPADWARYGKAAGSIRNQQMLDDGKPDLVLAFHENIASSKGTKDMVTRAYRAGIAVRIFTE